MMKIAERFEKSKCRSETTRKFHDYIFGIQCSIVKFERENSSSEFDAQLYF